MATIRIVVLIGVLAVVGVLAVHIQATPAASGKDTTPDSGIVTWGKDRIYWPDQSEPRYSVLYPTYEISDIAPGKENCFRVTVRNMTDDATQIHISVLELSSAEAATAEAKNLPDEWVSFSEHSSSDSTQVGIAGLHTIPENGELCVWCHVAIPKDKDLLEDKFQCSINVIEYVEGVAAGEGPECVVTVHTADDLATGHGNNAAWVFLVLVLSFLAVGGAVYAFSRWRWPN